jgi:tripartite-type tricarboxylate transporter receptor subunit TctC
VAAPAKTPAAIVAILNRQLNAVLEEPETRAIFVAQGYEPVGGSPEAFARTLADEVSTWGRVVRGAHVTFE